MKMKESTKLKKVKTLFDKINKIYPDNSISMSVHGIKEEWIPSDTYKFKRTIDGGTRVYMDQNKTDKSFGIDIFVREEE